jgi:hypothetical protein
MTLFFLLHSLYRPVRLASPQFTRRTLLQSLMRSLIHRLFGPLLQPARQKIRRTALARHHAFTASRTARHQDSCHFQLRAL